MKKPFQPAFLTHPVCEAAPYFELVVKTESRISRRIKFSTHCFRRIVNFGRSLFLDTVTWATDTVSKTKLNNDS